MSSYLEILFYLRPFLLLLECLVFAAAIDRCSLALKANIDATWAQVLTLGVSTFSLLVGAYLSYDSFSSASLPILAAALLGGLVCAQIGSLGTPSHSPGTIVLTGRLVAFMVTSRGMILNWALHFLLTSWQASQALVDWRVYTGQSSYFERSATALTASLVTSAAVFLMPFVIFWTPDQHAFGVEVRKIDLAIASTHF